MGGETGVGGGSEFGGSGPSKPRAHRPRVLAAQVFSTLTAVSVLLLLVLSLLRLLRGRCALWGGA